MKHTTKRLAALLLAAVMVFGLLPATALAAPGSSSRAGTTINVTDYGADPTGAKESSTAVIEALEYAKTLPKDTPKTIEFPKGEYHFYADKSVMKELYVSNTVGTNQSYKNKRLGILVEGMENVTVDGGGSQFIFHGDMTSFAAIDSKNVTFTNFSMDWASPSVIDVTVESRVEGENAAIVYIPPCYTYELNGTNIHWTVEGDSTHSGNNELHDGVKQIHDLSDGTTVRDSGRRIFNNVSSFEKLADNRLKITYSNAASVPAAGLCFQMRQITRTTPGIFFWQSENITVSNTHVQFLHGFGMVTQLCKDITLNGVKFAPRAGTGRTTAGFADFVQMSSVGGTVTITNCEFSGPHDDPINIHGTFLVVKEISSDRRTVTVEYQHSETAGFPQYYVGDQVDFSTWGTIIPVENSERTVEGVENFPDGNRRRIKVTLDEAIPSEIAVDGHVMENVTYIPEVQIDHCRFVSTPTAGILVTTRKPVVIENNFFDRMGMQAIYISCDAQSWYESGRVENVTIRGNTMIVNPRYGGDRGELTAIGIRPTNRTHDANRQIHSNITLEDNTFLMANNVYALSAKSVNTLTVRNNKFLRYEPNVTMTLSATSQNVAVGSSQASTLSASGLSYSNRLFRLEACKNVTFENNVYDDGLNKGVNISANTTVADVTNGDDLNVGGDKQLSGVGAVSYFSSNPAVAAVNESGVVTGMGPGTAEIYAYRTVAGRTFESNRLTFTVEGAAVTPPSKIEIGGGADAVDVNAASPAFTAAVTGSTGSVVWAVKPFTAGAAASIDQNGVLTATAPGVVEVTASLGGVTASKLVTVKKPKGLDESKWEIKNESAEHWTMDTEQGTVTITPFNAQGIYDTQDSLDNYFLIDAPDGDFEFSVKLHNRTCGKSNCWCEAGIIIYKDNNHYVTVDRKNAGGSRQLCLLTENDNKPAEPNITDPTSDVIYLKLKKEGTHFTSFYSTDGNAWTKHLECDNTSLNNNQELKLGFFGDCKGNGHDNTTFTFSDVKLNGTAVPLVSNNQAPTATGATLTKGSGTVTVDYTFRDPENDADNGTLFAWYVSDTEGGHYTPIEGANTATFTATALTNGKYVKAVVIPRDATGRFGAPATSAPVLAEAANRSDDTTLAALSVEGFSLTPAFDPAVQNYTVNVPSTVRQVTVNAVPASTGAQIKSGSNVGAVTLTGAKTIASVTVTPKAGSAADTTYTITINRAQSNNVTLENLTATAGSASITYAKGTRYYALTAPDDATQLSFSLTLPQGATAKARYNGEDKGNNSEWTTNAFPLAPGLNSLELQVTAEDGVSTALYRVVVLKNASTDASLSSLTVNGGDNLLPMTGNEAVVRLGEGVDSARIHPIANHYNATVHISVDGKPVEDNEEVELTKAVTKATVRVVAEDGVTEQVYTIILTLKDDTSAELCSLDLGKVALDTAFDANTENYTAVNYGNAAVALEAIATQAGATVTYETIADYKTADNGSVTGQCRFFKDVGVPESGGNPVNTVIVTVTSPDGSATKTYTIAVTVVEEVYLSDLDWMSGSYSGWQSIQKDLEVSGGTQKMQLKGQNGTETFEKGLGTHANSEIYYDLSGMGFTTFTAKVGMDYSQNNANQRLRFDVLADGINQYTQTDMGRETPYKTASATFSANTNQLTLKASYTTGNDGNAHADWADAKLSTVLPQLSKSDVSIQHLAFGENETHTIYANAGDANHTVTLEPTVKPLGVSMSAHERVLYWTSDDESVATVADGVVTAVTPGKTTITARALSGATADCEITVKWKLQGTPTVSGALKYDSELTADVNTFAQDAKKHLTYAWYRGATAEGTPLATTKTYTPVEADIGSVLTVKVAGDEDSLYEGSTTYTTGKIDKADGPTITGAGLNGIHGEPVSEAGGDGKIVGFPNDTNIYEYKAQNEPDTAYRTVDGTEVTGVAEGEYYVRIQETNTHKAGTPISVTVAPHNAVAHVINIGEMTPANAGTVTRRRGQAAAGEERVLTVRPAEGYQLAENGLTVTKDVNGGTVTLTPGDPVTEDGVTYDTYTFIMPNEAVTVAAEFELKTYTVTHGLTNITCDMDEHNHTVTHGERFTITLTPDEGHEMPNSITVTDEKGNRFNDYDYLPDSPNSPKRVLTFTHGVTANIKITGTATLKDYTVVYHITNGLTAPNAPQTATHATDFTASLSAAGGYALPNSITVEVNGTELEQEQYDYNTESGKIDIPGERVTGNVVITAAGVAEDVELKTVTLVGPARVGRVLKVNTVPVNAKVDYQWYYVENGVETPIPDAVNAQYNLSVADENKIICVKVTGKDGYAGKLTSAPTAAILPEAESFVFVETVTLDETATVAAGKTIRLTAAITPENPTSGTLFWSSDNEAVATVDQNGVVKGVAEGVVTITAAATDQLHAAYDTCTVTVTKATSPSRPSGGNTTPSETTTTETKDDGTTVTTVTKPDGSTTTTTESPDGTVAVVETKPDGSKTQTVEQPDGTKSELAATKDGDVTITVTDKDGEELVKAEIPATIPETETRFEDVPVGHWADKAIHNAAALDLVNGTGDNKYSPVAPMTRGSLATVLHRLSQGKTDYEVTFRDVAETKFYAPSVAWAAKAGVVTGYTADTFAPEDIITREQLAVMLARYAKLIGMNTKADAKALDKFNDGANTGSWAVDGMAWCVENGIIRGKDGNRLDPTTNVSRAEVAVMLDRFIELLK